LVVVKRGIEMANFKFVISDGKKSYQFEKDQKDSPVFGKKIGDMLDGGFLGLEGYELQITGGSDKDGFPMRKDIEGQMRKKFLIAEGVGFRTEVEGLKRRRMLRGNAISDDVSQINCKIVKRGDVSIEETAPKKEKKEN
jgi:small subunit ribosomal protein S6e